MEEKILEQGFPFEMEEESVESKIAGKRAEIDQLHRMIEVSDSESMKKVFADYIKNLEREIEKLNSIEE